MKTPHRRLPAASWPRETDASQTPVKSLGLDQAGYFRPKGAGLKSRSLRKTLPKPCPGTRPARSRSSPVPYPLRHHHRLPSTQKSPPTVMPARKSLPKVHYRRRAYGCATKRRVSEAGHLRQDIVRHRRPCIGHLSAAPAGCEFPVLWGHRNQHSAEPLLGCAVV
jgi:hypothetical protein